MAQEPLDDLAAFNFVDFVEDHERWLAVRMYFFQHFVNGRNLRVCLGMACIHDVEQKVGLDDFFEGRFKGLHETMGQFADKTDRVAEQRVLVCGQTQSPSGRVESGEEFIFGEDVRSG